MRLGRLRRRLRGSRGAVLVEAAFAMPVVFLLVGGMLEFGIAFKNQGVVVAASRSGARAASAMPKDLQVTQTVNESVAVALTGLVGGATPQEMYFYKANPTTGLPLVGATGSGSFTPAGCPSTTCVRYTNWNPTTRTFDTVSGSWAPNTQNACLGQSDSAGVWIRVRYSFAGGFFGAGVDLADRTVIRLEPLQANACAPT